MERVLPLESRKSVKDTFAIQAQRRAQRRLHSQHPSRPKSQKRSRDGRAPSSTGQRTASRPNHGGWPARTSAPPKRQAPTSRQKRKKGGGGLCEQLRVLAADECRSVTRERGGTKPLSSLGRKGEGRRTVSRGKISSPLSHGRGKRQEDPDHKKRKENSAAGNVYLSGIHFARVAVIVRQQRREGVGPLPGE